jgi:threonine dehydratase
MPYPISLADALAAQTRVRRYLAPTPARRYEPLDDAVGHGIRVVVKHENHQPTNSFKVRNGLALMTALDGEQRRRGVVAATRGNHGQGLAWAGRELGVPVTICVPHGNSPEKNAAMRGMGARLVEHGRDYDDALGAAHELVDRDGLRLAHSTNDPAIISGAATIVIELMQQEPALDALVIAVGGGSQAVGSLVTARALAPGLEVFGVQAAGAAAIRDSWAAKRPLTRERADTFADGLATRSTYAMTFAALCDGLVDFIAVSEAELAEAVRLYLSATHNLAEGAGAAGLAGLMALRDRLAGKTVGVILSGSNIDRALLAQILAGEL